jgi:predicted RNase H-like nuclease (RuvC/YqgF family)
MANQPAFLSATLRFTALLAGSFALFQAQAADGVPAQTAATQTTITAEPYHPTADAANLQQLQKESRQNAAELANLKETVLAQSLLIDQLRSPTSATTQASDPRAALKSKMDEQSRTIGELQTQLNDLKRGASNSESNASEISSLKQEISNLRSSVGRLESLVSSLSSKVK